jgi:hypothetical protein
VFYVAAPCGLALVVVWQNLQADCIMKVIRSGIVLVISAALGITGIVVIKQYWRIESLKNSRHRLAVRYQDLSLSNTSLVSIEADQNDALFRLQQQPPEVLRLRSQLTLARQELAAASASNQSSTTESTNEVMTSEQSRFVGFDTPENAFQSFKWASASGDYTNWLATLTSAGRNDELADPSSLERFRAEAKNAQNTRWQILDLKPVGNDRVELKVRIETENAVTIWIYPMVAVGNEWRIGDEDIHPISGTWRSPSSANDAQRSATQ